MAGKRRTWKLSDKVAAVFFGLWLLTLPFRPWLGGLDILVIVVGLIWLISLWATIVHGEYVPPPLTKKDQEVMKELEQMSDDLSHDPAAHYIPGNVYHRADKN